VWFTCLTDRRTYCLSELRWLACSSASRLWVHHHHPALPADFIVRLSSALCLSVFFFFFFWNCLFWCALKTRNYSLGTIDWSTNSTCFDLGLLWIVVGSLYKKSTTNPHQIEQVAFELKQTSHQFRESWPRWMFASYWMSLTTYSVTLDRAPALSWR